MADLETIWLGYDPRQAEAFYVCRESIRRRLNQPVPCFGLSLDNLREIGLYNRPTKTVNGQLWDVISEAPMSTEFAISRFLVPILARCGWALFMDSDMLVRVSLSSIARFLDPTKAVVCVKHNYAPMSAVKMDGQTQLLYARKNWSSLMAFNCDHPANKKLTVEMVNTLPGRDLHAFSWLKDEEIGEFPPEWNYLVGHTEGVPSPSVVHFTSGGPWIEGYEDVEFAEEWRAEKRRCVIGVPIGMPNREEVDMLISEKYQALQEDLHKRYNYGRGVDSEECSKIVQTLISTDKTVLDYGCGQGHLKSHLQPYHVNEYDPCIEGKRAEPEASDVVVCADVLEHIEPELLENVLAHIASLSKRFVILVIATNPSNKVMLDGRTAHLIVEGPAWWRQRLLKHFVLEKFEDRTAQGKGLLIVGRPSNNVPLEDLVEINEINTTAACTDDERNQQVKANILRVKQRVTTPGAVSKLPAHGREALLVCYGPSIRLTWPEIKMAKCNPDVDVFTVSGSHQYLLEEHNIIPYAHIDCDPRPHKVAQLGQPHPDVKYWLASCSHPDYLDKLQGHDVALWHSYNGPESLIAVQWEPEHRMIIGGGSVGMRAISLLYYLGYRKFEVHGMDCSFDAGVQHAGEHMGKPMEGVQVKCGDRWFETSPVFIVYSRYFIKQMQRMDDARVTLAGDGMLQHMVRVMNGCEDISQAVV